MANNKKESGFKRDKDRSNKTSSKKNDKLSDFNKALIKAIENKTGTDSK